MFECTITKSNFEVTFNEDWYIPSYRIWGKLDEDYQGDHVCIRVSRDQLAKDSRLKGFYKRLLEDENGK